MPSSLKTRLVLLNFFPIQSSLHVPFPFLSRQAALQYTNVPAETDTVRSLTQSQALLTAIREYEASKWKVIGQKVGKPAKVCLSFRCRF
jgi:hypothetical protein